MDRQMDKWTDMHKEKIRCSLNRVLASVLLLPVPSLENA